MNDVVFVMTNSKLAKKKKAKRSNPLKLEDLSSDDEWIMEDVGEDPGGDEVAAGNNSTDVPTQNGEEEAAGNNSKDVPTIVVNGARHSRLRRLWLCGDHLTPSSDLARRFTPISP
ncbi:unnamed protein product [Cuscuta campestris]|uniref:Uncharacterized protein n=1 Tax=Cuscuta campestris TaxID=132261 RepID=A0A484LXY0_9ASTE|nr:unnamed protein product [Cuscuta campestris]